MPKFNMSKIVVPGARVLPSGYYDFRVVSLEETVSRNSGLLMEVIELQVIAPKEFTRYRPLTHRIVLGKRAWTVKENTKPEEVEYFETEDPMCETELVQDRRLPELLGFATAMGWERAKDAEWDTADLVADINQADAPYTVGGRVVVTTQTEGKYAGNDQNEVKFFYAVGKHEAGPDTPKAAPTEPRTAKVRTRAATEATD